MRQLLKLAFISVLLVTGLNAQVLLRDTFIAVSSAPVTNAGEYLIGTGLTNAPNSAVYGGTVVGFNTNHLWYGSTALFVPQAGSLTYTGGVARSFVSNGGRLKIDLSADDDSAREVRRRIQGVTAVGSLYFSALLRATADSNGTAVVRFDDVDGISGSHSPYMWGCGFGFQNGNIVLITRSGSNSRITHTVMENYTAGETYLIVVRIDVDTNVGPQYNDTVSVWVKPAGLLSMDAGAPDFKVEINTITSNTILLIDELRILTSGFGGGVVEFDEIRMGRQWADVVPSMLNTDLIVYDDFETADGIYRTGATIATQNPPTPGFTAAWTESSGTYWQPYAENLGYTNQNQALVSSGGSVQVNMPSVYDRRVYRTTVNNSGASVYISCLMTFDLDGGGDDFAYAAWLDADDARGGIQWGVFSGKIGIRCRYVDKDDNHEFPIGDGSYAAGQAYLFVIKMEKNVSTYWDRMTVYLNPAELSSEAANTPSLAVLAANLVDSTVLDQIMLRSHQVSSGVFKVDEIRIGSSWEEVVPCQIVPYSPPGTLIMVN